MNQPVKPSIHPTWRKVYGAPILIGALSLSGLASALLLGEVGRYFSWIGVGAPICIVLHVVIARFRRAHDVR